MKKNDANRRVFTLGPTLAIALAVIGASPVWAVSARSSTIAASQDGAEVWVVNTDANTVSVVDTLTRAVVAETPVGRQPRTLAITPNGTKVYVACLGDNRVDVLDGTTFALLRSIAVGREPFGVAVAPNGARAYVANTATDTVSVIDTATDTVLSTINAGDRPRAVAISSDSATVAVTNFLTPTPSLNGTVQLIDAATLAVRAVVNLPTLGAPLNGVPNIIQSASYRPNTFQVWIPFVASITGAANLTLQDTVHPEVAIVDSAQNPPRELPGTRTNLNAVVFNPAVSQPTAVDFNPAGGIALVVNMASNDVTLMNAATRAEIRTVPVGSAPSGVAVAPDGSRAYVVNDLSRSVSIIDLTVPANASVVGTVVVTGETLPANVLNGKKLFFTSRGRMSTQNFLACISCHPDAGHDAREWIFTNNVGEGNRKTTDIRGMVDSGAIHWTANMDEPQDLEWNVRKINFGPGLIDGTPADPLAPEQNAGRARDLDDMAAFMDSLIAPVRGNPNRAPGGGLTAAAQRGKQLFMDSRRGCRSCHFGTAGTDSDRTTLVRHDVGTLAANDVNGQQGFDTMGLRNLYDAAPFLHDGTAPALQVVITNRNPSDRHGVTSDLTSPQQNDLVAFLLGFGSDRDELAAGAGVGLASAIRVPIRVRDLAFTALDGDDKRTFDRIQGFSLSLGFPTSGILGVTVAPAGIAASLPSASVTDPPVDLVNGRKAYTVRFGGPLPLAPERAAGQIVAVATFTLAPGGTGSFPVALDATKVALLGGPGAVFEKSESVLDENLVLANGTATVGTPEISAVELGGTPLTVSKSLTPGNLALSWEGVTGTTYDLYDGTLAALHAGTYDHACFALNLAAPTADLAAGPSSAYYLVAAKTAAFGLGSLGSNSAGVSRPNASPCP